VEAVAASTVAAPAAVGNLLEAHQHRFIQHPSRLTQCMALCYSRGYFFIVSNFIQLIQQPEFSFFLLCNRGTHGTIK
jgi:hypothetical protein